MNLFLPDKDSLSRFLLNEDQIRDLQFLSEKLKLHGEHFHVFLLGGTGSGKSTLLNCIADQYIASASVQRPTTTELTLYGDLGSFDIPDKKIKGFAPKSEDPAIFKSIVLWDFPDLDSHLIDNHKWSYLFRNYADCILLVVHPEKTKQASLAMLLKEYPGIPKVMVLTHKDQYSKDELEVVISDLQLSYEKIIAVDSISDAENTRTNLTEYFESIKQVGLQEFKRSNRSQLIKHCESALNTLKISLDSQISVSEDALKQTSELCETSSQIISSAVFQVFQEKIFAEIQSDLLIRLYKTTPGWSVLVLEYLSKFRAIKSDSSRKTIPYHALPFYSLQNESQVFSSSKLIFNSFRRDHMEMISWNQKLLRTEAQSFSVLHWFMALIMEAILPVWLVFQVLSNLSAGNFSLGLSLVTVMLGFLVCFITGFLRLRQRLKRCYNLVFKIYQKEVEEWFIKMLRKELDGLNSKCEEQQRSLESVNALLQLTHTGS